jgi:predicted GIY-YIG superfamily endonuclease
MIYNLYWIHQKDHTDMFTQGYIGITCRLKQRLYRHKKFTQNTHLKNAVKKYGWDNLVKTVILIADETYCLMVESQLRSLKNIGWNIIEGGGKPPLATGNKYRLGAAPWNKGLGKPKVKKEPKPRIAWNKGLTTSDEAKAKQSLAKIGRPSNRLGIPNSPETRLKISLANKGRRLPDEVYKRQGLSRLGKKQTTVTCPHCNKQGGNATMPRWHFNNCKEKFN